MRAGTPRIGDAALDYWGRVFTAGGFLDRGVSFDEFVHAPLRHVTPERAQLLADAGETERAMLADVPDARLRDCHLVEPLRHHAFNHHQRRR